MKRAILFDLDGTLIDTPSGIVQAFGVSLKSIGIGDVSDAAIRTTIGMPLEKAFASLLDVPAEDEKIACAIKQYQSAFKEIVLPKAKDLVFPGVVASLMVLKEQGIALAVATSKFYTSAEALLKAAELWDFFDVVIGADQVTHPKPHPEMGQLVLKKLGVSAENAIMVGDTTHDILMAYDAGMRSIAVTYGVHTISQLESSAPTWMAHSFSDVLVHAQCSA